MNEYCCMLIFFQLRQLKRFVAYRITYFFAAQTNCGLKKKTEKLLVNEIDRCKRSLTNKVITANGV